MGRSSGWKYVATQLLARGPELDKISMCEEKSQFCRSHLNIASFKVTIYYILFTYYYIIYEINSYKTSDKVNFSG